MKFVLAYRFTYLIFFLLLIFSSRFLYADHIVGGNLEMIAKNNVPGTYTMRLIIFQNEEIGTGGNESSNQGFMIYRTRDNQKMKFVIADIANFGEGNVVYFNDSCSQNRRLKTRKLVYEETVNLDPALYDDPAGYYVVWADGYRNLGLTNITNPYNTGIMLQLKFPPLKRNGQPFVNSSASFSEINGEYLCVNMPFSLHFDASDKYPSDKPILLSRAFLQVS